MRADARSNGGIIIHHGKMHLPVPPRPPAAMPVPAVQWLPEEPRQQAWAQTGQPSSLHVLLMPQDIQENWTSCPCHRPSACRGARTGEASYGCSTDMPWGRAPSSRVQCCLCSTVVRLPLSRAQVARKVAADAGGMHHKFAVLYSVLWGQSLPDARARVCG